MNVFILIKSMVLQQLQDFRVGSHAFFSLDILQIKFHCARREVEQGPCGLDGLIV